MHLRICVCAVVSLLFALPGIAANAKGVVHNEKVRVVERTLSPGEPLAIPGNHASVVVYLDDGLVETATTGVKSKPSAVTRGLTVFLAATPASLINRGRGPVKIVWTEYLGQGGTETWGTTGLAPHYTLLFENAYGRVYDIRIPAGTSEPRHSHHDRVVICLSGAQLRHEMDDGRQETSTLKTGEIAWRGGGTHVGHNLGQTDLWVIAIEPK